MMRNELSKNLMRSILIRLNIDQNGGMRKIPRAEPRAWWLSIGLAGREGRFDPGQFSGILRKSLTFLGHLAIQTRRHSLPPYHIVRWIRAPREALGRVGRGSQMQIRFDGMRWLPGLLTLRQYQVGWLPSDIVAGLVLSTMLVPVGMAYAVASGLPGIYGLYATIVPLLAYAVFGPSRILVLGPDSSLAAVILGVVLPLSAGDPQHAVALAGMMAVVSGIVCILAGVARLGFITELLSKPIRYGYMNGIALTVLISQLPKLFGFSIESDGPLRSLWAIAEAVVDGKTNWVALAIGAGSLVSDPVAQEQQTDTGDSRRCGGRDSGRWCV